MLCQSGHLPSVNIDILNTTIQPTANKNDASISLPINAEYWVSNLLLLLCIPLLDSIDCELLSLCEETRLHVLNNLVESYFSFPSSDC